MNKRRSQALFATLVLFLLLLGSLVARAFDTPAERKSISRTVPALNPVRYVNPFIGTVGNGNVFPGADVPFGMVQWSPDTGPTGITRPAGYFYGDVHITGFSLTHLSGAGCVSYNDVPFMPAIRPVTESPVVGGYPYSARFLHSQERASPGYYSVRLNSGITVQLSATRRTGLGQIVYPATHTATLVINTGGSAGARTNGNEASTATVQVVGSDRVTGSATSGHFCGLANTYTLYFAAVFSRPFSDFGSWNGPSIVKGSRRTSGRQSGAWVGFDTSRRRTVMVKVGVSFVSVRNALLNLRAEDPGWSLRQVRARAAAEWNRVLNRIQARGSSPEQLQVLYTALYHSLLHPNTFSDVNGQYIGFDSRIHTARDYIQYANFSGWDIYRTQVQLIAWLLPREASDMMQSLVEDAKQGGRLPKWPVANSYTGAMNGDSADPIIADAVAFGARHFDVRAALRYMVKGASQEGVGRNAYQERPAIADYLRLGYAPPQTSGYGSAATTLEYAVDDFAIAQVAQSLHDTRTFTNFMHRAQAWQRVFNPATGFVEATNGDGSFPVSFDPASLSGFVEGDSWQYSWAVPHNLAALIRAMGGNGAVVRRLDRFFSQLTLNAGTASRYDWVGNEPGLEVPWEYAFAGQPWRTQAVVRQIMTQFYLPKPWGLPGNDDLGTLSAWYVWAALGLYPEIPGVGGLVIGSPLFPSITVRPEGDRGLVLVAPRASVSRPYVQKLKLNGRLYTRTWLSPRSLAHGSTLRFDLDAVPHPHWGSSPRDAPPSYSSQEAPALGFTVPSGGEVLIPGRAIGISLGVRTIVDRRLTIRWTLDRSAGVIVEPSSGVFDVRSGAARMQRLSVSAAPALSFGSQTVRIHLRALRPGAQAAGIPDVVFHLDVR